LRIVFDTNIWISYLLGKRLSSLSHYIFSGRITILYSHELLDELISVLSRPKFAKSISQEQITAIVQLITDRGEEVVVSYVEPICRDPKDDFLLALASSGNADYLITGDDDLLVLGELNSVKIQNPASLVTLFLNVDWSGIRWASLKLQSLNHTIRKSIIKIINDEEQVTKDELVESLKLSSHIVGQHVAILRRANFVNVDKVGNELYYSLNIIEIEKVVNAVDKFNKA
jgi:putative PIN family toxin of toxin-antitoxin system